MTILTTKQVKDRAQQYINEDKIIRKSFVARESRDIIFDSVESFSESKTYDIFLSHRKKDSDEILGIKGILEDLSYSVYIDWIDDPELDRNNITKETADQLRKRMKRSRSLLYVDTENSAVSKWMPWECGYFDALKEKVAIIPITNNITTSYKGQEYLGLYPYCELDKSTNKKLTLWIHKDKNTYTSYDNWVKTDSKEIVWKKQG